MVATSQLPVALPNANDRLKERFRVYFWSALLVATAVHFVLLAFWPQMRAADVSITTQPMEQVEVPTEFEIPPPPEALPRPAVPIASMDADLDVNLTVAPNTFEENPPTELPPPPVQSMDLSAAPAFTPHEVSPEMRNRAEFGTALSRRYPVMLRDAGIGGTAMLWVYIDEAGEPGNTKVVQTSGYEQLDSVAAAVIREVARFTPALNRGQAVPVWIQIPIIFKAEQASVR